MDNVRVSVAMTTYNGEKYVKEQIDSILINLTEKDELVISDDGSTDKTIEIIKSYNDPRIKLIEGLKKGVKKNFENAIAHTTGEYVFLADQDDIWSEDKVEKVLKELYNNVGLVIHDAIVFDSDYNQIIYDSFFKYRNSGKGIIKNIYKNTYIGCCMAFKKDLKEYIIPIPNDIEMHDQWIGLIAEKYGNVLFLKEKLIKYRRHSGNVSSFKHYPLAKMIKNRINLIKNLVSWNRSNKKQ